MFLVPSADGKLDPHLQLLGIFEEQLSVELIIIAK